MGARQPARHRGRLIALVAALVVVPGAAAGAAVAFSTLDRAAAEDRGLGVASPTASRTASSARPERSGSVSTGTPTTGPGVRVGPARSTVTSAPGPVAEPAEVVRVQRLLLASGRDVGDVDGEIGPRTAAALVDVQRRAGLPSTGQLDARTARAVDAATAGVVDRLPASVTVDLSEQSVTAFNAAGAPIDRWPVSTGAPGSDTPTGSFAVLGRMRVGQSAGHAEVHMDYFTVFDGDVGFHGIPWVGVRDIRLDTPLGETPVSAGCIRMADHHAAWLYTFLPDDAPVIVEQ